MVRPKARRGRRVLGGQGQGSPKLGPKSIWPFGNCNTVMLHAAVNGSLQERLAAVLIARMPDSKAGGAVWLQIRENVGGSVRSSRLLSEGVVLPSRRH